MSIEYVRAVLELDRPVGLQRLLLLAIAEHADRNGLADPGNACLAEEAKISERQIRRMIPQMEAQGFLQTVQQGNGRGNRRIIRLTFAPASLSKRGTTATTKGDMDDIKGDKRGTSERERGTTATIKGDMVPEVEADNPINPINPKPMGGDLDLKPREREDAPPPPLAQSTATGTGRAGRPAKTPKGYPLVKRSVTVRSPYLREPRKFRDGYIPAGQGSNAVEVYYERFDITNDRERLSAPMEDDLVRACPELERLREVIVAYGRRKNYAPGNLQLILDWYRKGIPEQGGRTTERQRRDEQQAAARANGQSATSHQRYPGAPGAGPSANSDAFRLAEVKLTAELINRRIDQAEYDKRYAQLRADYGLPNLPGGRALSAS